MLKRVTLQSSGLYRCEVSGEAPAFNTVSESETMTVVGKSQLSECLMEFSLQKAQIAITDSVRKKREKEKEKEKEREEDIERESEAERERERQRLRGKRCRNARRSLRSADMGKI